MNGKIIFAFVLGAAAGFAASWKYNELKYKIADEEIESVKQKFSIEIPEVQEEPEPKEDLDPVEEAPEEIEKTRNEYSDLVEKQGYTDYSNIDNEEKGGGIMDADIYVISPNEYGDLDDYEQNELTYYADGILADDCDDIIDDVENVVGEDSLMHFGEYEDDPDTVYVRNDILRTDYEINRDERRYADVVKGIPTEDYE